MKIIKIKDESLKILPNHIFTTAGTETELQVAVEGSASNIDIVQNIQNSLFYKNLKQRVLNKDISPSILEKIDDYLNNSQSRIWENSWVRIPIDNLSEDAKTLFSNDLLKDKSNPLSGFREDYDTFFININERVFVRIPVSYLIKIALTDLFQFLDQKSKSIGESILKNFSNDNTSPETLSLYLIKGINIRDIGVGISEEYLLRYLLTQLAVEYSNIKFALTSSGQKVVVYESPLPPVNQRSLNSVIPDELYREIFVSPSLSGWDKGEEKKEYMHLCHKVLSMSKLKTISKCKDAGLLKNNLVILPDISTTSLSNNGIHINIGSSILEKSFRDSKELGVENEKYFGDLVIKIVEHFISLFPSNYSASPHRLNFENMHPETALGFLPHELDYTHLRMLWRKWKNKAKIKLFGKTFTPFGPEWVDKFFKRVLRLKGDFVPDYRLLDYLVAPLSTSNSPAFDGKVGNHERLKKELNQLGIFHKNLSFYCFYRLREINKVGWTGFEGRYYSLFDSIIKDMSSATSLQILITEIAYRLAASGKITHSDIPDTPTIESERRFPIFASAIGLKSFFVNRDSKNVFMQNILKNCKNIKKSSRYNNYFKVKIDDYNQALINFIKQEGSSIIENSNLHDIVADLENRVKDKKSRVSSRLTKKICSKINIETPFDKDSESFNLSAESFYREDLRMEHISEAFDVLERLSGCEDYKNLKSKMDRGQLTLDEIVLLVTAILKIVEDKTSNNFSDMEKLDDSSICM